MSELSTRLALPYMQAAQAQKHVTHNEALERLDLLAQLSVAGFNETTPPVSPVEGQVWALGTGCVDDWAGHDGELAAWSNGGWLYAQPLIGWRAALGSDLRVWTGTAWVRPELSALQNLDGVGINTTFDATNKLAVSADASLLTHAGGGHQVKVNKAAPGETASLLFQTGWSGRAEIGTAGSDDLSIKVSADGSNWNTALSVAGATGAGHFQSGLQVTGQVFGTAVVQGQVDNTPGRLLDVGAFGVGAGAPPDITDFTASLLPGFYRASENAVTGGPPGYTSAYKWQVTVSRAYNGVGILVMRQTSNPANQRVWYGARSSETGAVTWHEVAIQSRWVGSVSQTGGVPQGAIIERGANANGDYVRFADGTQRCWAALGAGSIVGAGAGTADDPYRSAALDWVFPAGFAAAPAVSFHPEVPGAALAARLLGVSASGRSALQVSGLSAFRMNFANSTAGNVTILCHADGRWF